MKIFGAFIGISKYHSSEINNLNNASRDAHALWSLFTDTFPDTQLKLLVDEQASNLAIQNAIVNTLGKAETDDIAIITFSGHGTQNHRLVAYDTSTDNHLNQTSISMEFLAEEFKKSKARVIICVLDCCFSGGAPAKVLENTPVLRDINDPFKKLSGRGRILLAASNASQPAYEYPGVGHGLLTEALIQCLKSDKPQLDLTIAIQEIIKIVQAEAERIGVTQTPVVLNLIEGELIFPSLQEGEHYLSLFPPKYRISISKEISELLKFGFPSTIIQEWQQKFPQGLNSLQLKAVNNHKILAGESLLVISPTSSGKTFIGEMAAIRTTSAGGKAVFLLPYKALVNEKYQEFSTLYGSKVGMTVIRCSGDYSDHTANFLHGKYDIAILTFEMFLNIVVTNSSVLNQIELVVLDEAQFITDPTRGINVELLLTSLLSARQRGVSPQLIALSAVIGDANKFDTWLKLDLLSSLERPVPLMEGVMDRTGLYKYIDVDGDIKEMQLIPPHSIQIRKDKPSAQDMIVPLVSNLANNNEKVLIFRNKRGSAQGCANYLAATLNSTAGDELIKKLPNLDQSSSSQTLRNCLLGGTAFHTSNLSKEEREIIEMAFRDPSGSIKVLAATTTVAAGINTTASTVIIAEQEFIGEDGRAFSVAEYKNMAGRAGRLGFSETGKSIILAENAIQKDYLFQKYILGKVENMTSSFQQADLNTWIIRLLAQVKFIPRQDIIRLLVNTYGGYLITLSNPTWPKQMEEKLSSLLSRMLSLGLLEQENDHIQLTLLGRACGNSSLAFESSLRLVDLIRQLSSWQLSAITLLALIQILQECDAVYTPISRRGVGEQKQVQQATNRYGLPTIMALQKYANDNYHYQARCKRAAIVFDWIQGVPINKIEKEFSYNSYQGAIQAGHIRSFADNARFHLRSAFMIAMSVVPQNLCTEDELNSFLQRLEVGLPQEGLDLLQIPIPMSRGEYIALLSKKICNKQSLSNLSKDEVSQILGDIKATQLDNLHSLV